MGCKRKNSIPCSSVSKDGVVAKVHVKNSPRCLEGLVVGGTNFVSNASLRIPDVCM